MDRVVGIETEYGCLLSEDEPHVNSELWPAKVKNYLFRKADAGTIDLALSRLRGTAGQRRLSPERRPALSRHGAHRVRVAGMFASARSCHVRAGWRRPVAIGAHCSRRGRPCLVHQEQRGSSHRGDVRLPRELSDATRSAVHAADPRDAANVFSDTPDFYRRRASWTA